MRGLNSSPIRVRFQGEESGRIELDRRPTCSHVELRIYSASFEQNNPEYRGIRIIVRIQFPVCALFSLSRRPSRGVKKKGGDGKKGAAISRLKPRRCYVWWSASRIGRREGVERIDTRRRNEHPLSTGDAGGRGQKNASIPREKEEGGFFFFFFFFAIPRRLFRILIKRERVEDKGWRLAISRLKSTKFRGWRWWIVNTFWGDVGK